ncbi:2'-5' RNA ligase family protein [Aquabacterium sp. A7-Y]|uniref:2'-5' RNA ligase family protein n=1 Tax=Aquabacterium sp. A7-Y TaxID=1349605 RepID=UPI00223D4AA4|nr:2'-5' RNA ligase family protein [Aquabacterium sp. A7-Y]MCW7539451.1 2'-5' RNA ligase family protein [Aquabacterium sp. A7-Y]
MPITALAVQVPEAEPLVASLRERYDPTVRLGVPAHITLLVPFMAPALVTPQVQGRIEEALKLVQPFDFELARVGRFPGVAYLAPQPAAPFIALTESLVRSFPAYPPYEGQFSTVIPHLTVAHGEESDAVRAAAELEARLDVHGPLRCHCKAVVLLENSTGLWTQLRRFELAHG